MPTTTKICQPSCAFHTYVHDVWTLKFVYLRIIFRIVLHITIVVHPKWRNLVTKIPADQWQAINHKVFETKCY